MSAANLSEAIGNFKAAAGTLRAFIDLADKLEGLGDIERAEKEIGGILASKQKELAALDERVAALKSEAETTVADAKALAAETVANARESAERAIADAKAKSGKIVDDARINAEAQAQAADEAEARAAEAQAKAGEATATLTDLEARIETAREKISDLLKG